MTPATLPGGAVCYNFSLASSNAGRPMKEFDLRDLALRGLIVLAGVLAAVLLVLKGQANAVPALAVGATLGAFAMGRFGASEE